MVRRVAVRAAARMEISMMRDGSGRRLRGCEWWVRRPLYSGHHDEEAWIAASYAHCCGTGLLFDSYAWRGYVVSGECRISKLVGWCCLCSVRDPDWGFGIVYCWIQTASIFGHCYEDKEPDSRMADRAGALLSETVLSAVLGMAFAVWDGQQIPPLRCGMTSKRTSNDKSKIQGSFASLRMTAKLKTATADRRFPRCAAE